MLIFGENSEKMDTPTKMALAQRPNNLRIKNGFHHRVPMKKSTNHAGLMVPPKNLSVQIWARCQPSGRPSAKRHSFMASLVHHSFKMTMNSNNNY
jgi:hypothetical protein